MRTLFSLPLSVDYRVESATHTRLPVATATLYQLATTEFPGHRCSTRISQVSTFRSMQTFCELRDILRLSRSLKAPIESIVCVVLTLKGMDLPIHLVTNRAMKYTSARYVEGKEFDL